MKKTYPLTHPKALVDRLIEGIKSDIRKYLKRERAKDLPEAMDYWDFDCKFGSSAESATAEYWGMHCLKRSIRLVNCELCELLC